MLYNLISILRWGCIMNNMCLISDIGGTNIRLAIADKKLKDYHLLKTYRCDEFETIKDAIQNYLNSIPTEFHPNQAILAIAAAISSDHISMTNHNWSFSISELTKELNFNKIEVINDFEAQAHSVPFLKKDKDVDCIIKAKNVNSKFQNLVIAGSGTGLGTSLLFSNNSKYQVMPTECGHSMMGAYNNKEQAIFNYFTNKNQSNSYAEAFLSGKGIINIYNALSQLKGLETQENISSEFIFKIALEDFKKQKSSIYFETMETFCELLGTYIANLALTFLPKEIYLTGGILPSILPYLKNGSFNQRFYDKKLPTIKEILNSISVYLIVKENPAMLGLTNYFFKSQK